MSQKEIALSAFVIIGGTGLCLILASIIIKSCTKIKNNKCTARAEGTVVKHSFLGDGRMAPVISFEANGINYICKKKFNGIKKVVRVPSLEAPSAWEDEKGYLCVRRGMVANMRSLASELWPIGRKMIVFYDPDNPKNNYAGRPTTNDFVTKVFLLSGVGLVALGGIMFFVIK